MKNSKPKIESKPRIYDDDHPVVKTYNHAIFFNESKQKPNYNLVSAEMHQIKVQGKENNCIFSITSIDGSVALGLLLKTI